MAPRDGHKPGHGGSIAEPVMTEVPDGIPRHRGDGRPWIRKPGDHNPAPGVVTEGDRFVLANQRDSKRGNYYSRASSACRELEDEYRLERWKRRTAVQGVSRDPGLLARMQSMRILEQDDPGFSANRDEWDSLAELAIDAGKGGVGAAQGTAFHLLTERRDAGEDLSYLPANLRRALDTWDAMMGLFTIHGTEQFVVCDELGIAGTYDRLLEPTELLEIAHPKTGAILGHVGPGDRIIGDLKSGRQAKYFGPKYLGQQLPYAAGTPYTHAGGRMEWPGGVRPSQDWAVIPHISHLDGGATAALHWVNLARARQAYEVREVLRAFRKLDDMFVIDPQDFTGRGVPGEVHTLGLIGMLRRAEDESELERLWDEHGGTEVWTVDCDRMASKRSDELAATGQPR